MIKNIIRLLCLILITGCASQKAIEPDSIISEQIPNQWQSDLPVQLNVSEIWWNEFQDENLNQFLSIFLEENINLEQAMLNTRIAKQSAVLSTANFAPSVGIAASGTEAEQNTAGFPPIFTSFFGNSDEITTFTQENYSLSLNSQ